MDSTQRIHHGISPKARLLAKLNLAVGELNVVPSSARADDAANLLARLAEFAVEGLLMFRAARLDIRFYRSEELP